MKKLIFLLVFSVTLQVDGLGQGCAAPTSEEGVNVFGFFQPQYDFRLTDDFENTFRFNRMRFGVMGNIPYDFSYYALLEASPFINSGETIYLIDAFVTYSRYKNFRVSVGSFKKPFGNELSMPCSGLYTIERSQFVNELTGPTNRDFGLMILGGSDTTFFEYRIAVMNGTGLGVFDDNNFKDLYGRFLFKPVRNLTIGLNTLYGKSPAITEGAPEDERLRLGTDFQFGYRKLKVVTEFIYSKDIGSYTSGGGCDGGPPTVHQGSIERNGFYVMGIYDLNYKVQPVIKYEQYDEDMSKTGSNVQKITYGLNYYFNDWTRLQVNYLYKAEDPEEVKNDAILLQLQVKF